MAGNCVETPLIARNDAKRAASGPQSYDLLPYGVGDPAENEHHSNLGITCGLRFTPYLDSPRANAVKRRYVLQSIARDVLPDHRVQNCHRVATSHFVEVHYHPAHMRASYGGLQTCGSAHICPVCGSKIAERRSAEISKGAAVQLDRGGGLVMATFTLQHQVADKLEDLQRVLNQSYRRMRGGKAWQAFEQRYDIIGSITAREYTHGAHGWHPHLHVLFFVRGGLNLRDVRVFERWLKTRWAKTLRKMGAFAAWRRGVKCDLANDGASAYIAKSGRNWTVGDELAKANSKVGRAGGSRTVPELLWAAGHGDRDAVELYQEYAAVTRGTSLIRWSPGLRAILELDEEQTDEAVAVEQVAEGRLLVLFEKQQWRAIVGNDARAEVLLVASTGDANLVAHFVLQFGIELRPEQLDPRMPAQDDFTSCAGVP